MVAGHGLEFGVGGHGDHRDEAEQYDYPVNLASKRPPGEVKYEKADDHDPCHRAPHDVPHVLRVPSGSRHRHHCSSRYPPGAARRRSHLPSLPTQDCPSRLLRPEAGQRGATSSALKAVPCSSRSDTSRFPSAGSPRFGRFRNKGPAVVASSPGRMPRRWPPISRKPFDRPASASVPAPQLQEAAPPEGPGRDRNRAAKPDVGCHGKEESKRQQDHPEAPEYKGLGPPMHSPRLPVWDAQSSRPPRAAPARPLGRPSGSNDRRTWADLTCGGATGRARRDFEAWISAGSTSIHRVKTSVAYPALIHTSTAP